MAYWDSEKQIIVHYKDCKSENYPKWDEIDCGCCNGLEWGGEEPRECNSCNGTGRIFRHRKTGVLAVYPGGPFRGKDNRKS